MKSYLLFGFCLVFATATLAADVVSEPERVDAITILAGTKLYPQGLAERGVQGTVTLRADLSAEGAFSNPTIQESSRSEELDHAALALAPRLKYRPTKAANVPMPTAVVVPIAFLKDSLESLKTKTCADFNLDGAYFKEVFPEKTLSDMPVFDITAGALFFVIESQQRIAFAKNLKQIKERVVSECAQSSNQGFLEVALKATKESL